MHKQLLPSDAAVAFCSAQTGTNPEPLFPTELFGKRAGDTELEGYAFRYKTRNALHEDIMRLNDDLDSEHLVFVLCDRMYNVGSGCDVTLGLVKASTWLQALEKVKPDPSGLGCTTEQLLGALSTLYSADDLQLLGAGADWIEFWPNHLGGTEATAALLEQLPQISKGCAKDDLMHQADTCGTVFLSWDSSFRL